MLNNRLTTKLVCVIAIVIVLKAIIVWLCIKYFAASYFTELLQKYNVPRQDEVMNMFLEAAHRGLVWGSLLALACATALGYMLVRMILGPLYQMIAATRVVSEGDYTARVRVSSQDEVGELARAFNTMTDNLQRIEELRKKMVIDLAHELRAPLTNMRGYLEALTTGVLPATSKIIESLNDETLRLGNLAEDLMRLSVADAASLTLQKEAVELPALIGHSLRLFQSHFSEKTITVETQYPSCNERVLADSEKLSQIIQNLLDNAWRYTPRGGYLRISVARSVGTLKTVFANSGDPIGAEHLSRIFERFYRVDPSRSRERGGAGIGLALVKELTEAHGGRVGAESSSGENRIWFTLPD